MSRRKSHIALMVLAAGILFFVGSFVHTALMGRSSSARLENTSALVARLGLSDLALFTEARYTRHPSQADLHSAFQDHPAALDHFPTGSLIAPPRDFGPSGGFASEMTK